MLLTQMTCHKTVSLALYFQICNKLVEPLIRKSDFLVLGLTLLT